MLCKSSILLMAQMVRERQVSPVELLEAHLLQIEKHNPYINAFISVHAEQARADAKRAEQMLMDGETPGPLHGIPVTVKDSFDMARLPTLCGSRFRAAHVARRDSTAARRFKAAGAVILGKTSTPEFLNMYETDNHLIGRTNNPWNLQRTAGGSSGGESAAIAAYCSAGGIGSDGGGSIRVPAHFCGIAGLKPTPGRVSAAGHFPQISHPGGLLGVGGPMARSAQDVRLLFAALSGHDPEDPFSAPVSLRAVEAKPVRVGVWLQFYDVPVSLETAAVLRNAALCAAQSGMGADPFEPRDLRRAQEIWWIFFERLSAPLTQALIAGREAEAHWSGTELMHRALQEPPVTTPELLNALAERDQMRSSLLQQMDEAGVAAILMPVSGTPAFEHRQRIYPIGDGRSIDLLESMAPVTPWNLLGMPAMVIPFGMSADGLPIGVQIVGRPWDEEVILDVAVKLEQARGVFAGPPGY